MSVFNTWEQRRTRMPHLRVRARLSFTSGYPHPREHFLKSVTSVGDVATTRMEAGVILPDGGEYAWPFESVGGAITKALPFEIAPAEGHLCGALVRPFAARLSLRGFTGTVLLRAFYRDYKGTTYKAEPLDVDVNHWLNPPKVG